MGERSDTNTVVRHDEAMRVAAFIGDSGSGKTTLIRELIAFRVAAGERVAAIKHTHHPLNREQRGDSAAFFAAGARPVIFAGNAQAMVHGDDGARVIDFSSPAELIAHAHGAIVLVEGFKSFRGWPRLEVRRRSGGRDAGGEVEVSMLVDDAAAETRGELARLVNPASRELSLFLDRIWNR